MNASRRPADDVAGAVVPPPLLYSVPLVAGAIVHRVKPLPIFPPNIGMVLGPFLIVLGLVAIPAIRSFYRAGTSPKPWQPSKVLVTDGVYKLSRNPMYLGFTLIYLGVTAWVNTWWPVFALPLIFVVMDRGQIAREEEYLERRFGDEYRRYKARVRRWI
jgi:protein-S-isoprenylcysteine O-methyltransferase Ste14